MVHCFSASCRWVASLLALGLLLSASYSRGVQVLPDNWPAAPSDIDTTGFALILGGGGVRGIAHIGVIQVLEELDMRPGLIVGTSMGAVVGALYASGVSSRELESMALEGEWLGLFVDIESPPAQMQGGWWGLPPHQLSLQITQWPPLPDTGVSYGQGVETLLGEWTSDALFVAGNDFDRLPIPFRCVSSDLLNSKLVIHEGGSLARAVKASGSIPMIFHAVEHEGRHLVDGGFLDNLPVQVARRLGFDRAVLVDVSNVHLPDKRQPADMYQMWVRVAELQQMFANEVIVGKGDVLLEMPLEQYRSMNFGNAKQILKIGRETTRRHEDELLALRRACGPASLGLPPERPRLGSVTMRKVEVKGLQRMRPGCVLGRLGLQAGDRLELSQAWRQAARLAREGSFHNVWLEFDPVAGDTADASVHVLEELELRLELAGHVVTDDVAAIMSRLRADNLLGRGGAAALNYRYSEREARLDAIAAQTITNAGSLGLIGRFLWLRERPRIYDEGVAVDRHVFRRTQLGLDLTARLLRLGWTLYAGVDVGQTNSYVESRSVPGAGEQPLRTLHVALESHERQSLVSHQLRGARLRYIHSFGDTGDEPQWWRFDLGLVLPTPRSGRWRPLGALGAVASSADIPVVNQGRAGGPRGWVGLRRQEIIAPQVLWSRVALQYLLGAGAHVELAGALGWSGQRSLAESHPIWGGGLELGMDSPVGPLRLGYALATERRGYIYVQIGYDF